MMVWRSKRLIRERMGGRGVLTIDLCNDEACWPTRGMHWRLRDGTLLPLVPEVDLSSTQNEYPLQREMFRLGGSGKPTSGQPIQGFMGAYPVIHWQPLFGNGAHSLQ